MAIHQPHNSIGKNAYNASIYEGGYYESHFHRAYEFVLMLSGTAYFEIDGESFTIKEKEALLITPFQFHSFKSEPSSKFLIIPFSANLVESFSTEHAQLTPVSPVFIPDSITVEIIEKKLLTSLHPTAKNSPNNIAYYADRPDNLNIKSALYTLCSDIKSKIRWKKKEHNDSLALTFISYIEQNYTTDITLRSMADALGYDYRYASRIFNKIFNLSVKTLLNQFRCDKAQSLIQTTELSLSEIALSSGFQSIRTFNRVFKEIIGVSPSSLRKS